MEELKKCCACLEEKELCKFHKNKQRPDGLCDKCKKCLFEKRPSARFIELLGETQDCAVCGIKKDLVEFPSRTDRDYKYEKRCKVCKKEGLVTDKKIFEGDSKKCSICKEFKHLDEHSKKSSAKNGVNSCCKKCEASKTKKYRDSLTKDVKKRRKQEDYNKNRDKYILRAHKWVENNRAQHNRNNKIRTKYRTNTEPLFKLKSNIRSLIRSTFVREIIEGSVKKSKTFDILDCNISHFMKHIESQFLSWMNWNNYGFCKESLYDCTWQLDHIIPISLAKTEENLYLLNHWSNFQPLCGKKNLEKSDNVFPCTNLELKITIEDNKIKNMNNKVNLPSIYTEEMWKRGNSVPEHKKYIGLPYVSWSQVESFNDKSGFNTGLLGEFEYILGRFSKVKFPDMGWGQFGSETEAYITLRNLHQDEIDKIEQKVQDELSEALKNFNIEERKVLDTIESLGTFQDEICYFVEEIGVIVLGYIDDRSPEKEGKVHMLRDYKTKSEASKKDLHDDKKHQIELYILGLRQRGLEVQNAEYCIIERLGGRECMQGGGRPSLSIGKRVWYEPYSWDEERLKVTHQMIIDTVLRISSVYTTYEKYFK